MIIINLPFIDIDNNKLSLSDSINALGLEIDTNEKLEIKPEKFVFIIDISKSMGKTIQNSRYAKKYYVSKMFKYLFKKLKKERVENQETTISLITFNEQVHFIFRDYTLDQVLDNPDKFIDAIISYGGTRTDIAIEYVLHNFDNTYKFILITDGACNDPVNINNDFLGISGDMFFKKYLVNKLEEITTNCLTIHNFSIIIIGDGPLESSRYMVEKYNSTLHYISSQLVSISSNEFFDEAQFEHICKIELLKAISDNSDIKTDINICCSDYVIIYNSTVSVNSVSYEDEIINPNTIINIATSTFGKIRIYIDWLKLHPNSNLVIEFKDSNGIKQSSHIFLSNVIPYDPSILKHNKIASRFLTTLMNKLTPTSDDNDIDSLIKLCNLYPEVVKSKFIIQLEEFKNMSVKERSFCLMSSRTDERMRTPPRSVSPFSPRELIALGCEIDINGKNIAPDDIYEFVPASLNDVSSLKPLGWFDDYL